MPWSWQLAKGETKVALVPPPSSPPTKSQFLRPTAAHEPLRLSKARGPPEQAQLPPKAEIEGIDPVYPE
jgi:hypothetical protein